MAKNAFFRFRYKTTKIKKYTYQKYISGVLVLHELNFCSFWGQQNTNKLASLLWTKYHSEILVSGKSD